MNDARVELTKGDIKEAVNEWLGKKYSNFEPQAMWLKYNGDGCEGYVTGKLLDKEGK